MLARCRVWKRCLIHRQFDICQWRSFEQYNANNLSRGGAVINMNKRTLKQSLEASLTVVETIYMKLYFFS